MRLINYRSNFVGQQDSNINQSAKQHKSIFLNMSHKSALSKNELSLNTDLEKQSSKSALDIVGLATNAYIKLGIFLSLALIIHLPGFNRSVQANDSTSSAFSTKGSNRNTNRQSHPEISTMLPRVFNLIASSIRSQSAASFNSAQHFSIATSPPQRVKSTSFNSVSNNRQFDSTKAVASAKPENKPAQRIHQVKQGDTITKIARKYDVSNDEIVDINQISNSNVIFVDQRLKIPAKQVSSDSTSKSEAGLIPNRSENINRDNASTNELDSDPYIAKLRREIDLLRAENQQRSQANVAPTSLNTESNYEASYQSETNRDRSSQSKAKLNTPLPQLSFGSNLEEEPIALTLPLPPLPDSQEYLPSAFDGYIWPAQGVLTSSYGWRWGRMHRGIDIAAPIGTPIFAAASGKVVGAGWHSGYGNLVKLEHLDGSYTLYAHNHRNLVRHGQRVKQGEQIAEMGSTGRSTGSHLHFEIHREDRRAINPLAMLERKY